MTEEEFPPYEEEGDSKLPLILGVGLGLGAVFLLSKGKPAVQPNSIKIQSVHSECISGQLTITLQWDSTTQDLDFDVWSDRMQDTMHIEETIRSKSWTSPSWPVALQGKVLTFKISGKQTGINSPEIRATLAMCNVTDQNISSAAVQFS